MQISFSHYINIWSKKNRNIWQPAKRSTHNEQHTQKSNCVNFKSLTLKINPGMPKMSQSNFGVMRIFDELRYTISKLMRTFYLKGVPARFQRYLRHIYWVISGTSSLKLSCNPRHPSRIINCNHRQHLLQPSWRRIFSTSNNQKTRVDSDINSDYKASSFDRLHIWHRKYDTAGFVRSQQRKYWNAITVGRGHDDDGCSCNHRAVTPSVNGDFFRTKLIQLSPYQRD